MCLWLVIIIAAFAYFLFVQFYWRRRGLPPGPVPLPVLGNLPQMDFSKPHVSFQEMSKKHGKIFTFWMGNIPNVVITDYELIKEALRKFEKVFDSDGYPVKSRK